MSPSPLELVHGRSRYMVVPRSHVEPRPTELAARRLVEEALREGSVATAAALERLAEGLVGRPVSGVRDAARLVVQGLVEGKLVAVEQPRQTRALVGEEAIDLRTLGGWELEEPLRPQGPPRQPPPVEPNTWVSFEVVDERGVPAEGRYRLALDAKVEAGELARRGHHFDGLREGAAVQLAVEELAWDDTAPWPNTPGRGDDPRPAGDGLFSLELVDERGVPLHGRLLLTDGDRRVAEGVLAHRWSRALPAGEPLTLELTELTELTELRAEAERR